MLPFRTLGVDLMSFHLKLLGLMRLRGMTQEVLAAQIGRPQPRISKWCNGIGQPRPAELLLLARALDVPISYLCDESAEEVEGRHRDTSELSEDERLVLRAARHLTPRVALDRLLVAGLPDEQAHPSPSAHPPVSGRRVPPPKGKGKGNPKPDDDPPASTPPPAGAKAGRRRPGRPKASGRPVG